MKFLEPDHTFQPKFQARLAEVDKLIADREHQQRYDFLEKRARVRRNLRKQNSYKQARKVA